MSDHEELEGTVAAWVLGALDADEAESMRVHVEGCATCRQTAVRFRRAGHGALAAAHGTVIDLKNDGVTLVDFSGLPALDKGKVYEVWLITPGGHPDSAAVFVPDSNGSKVVLVNMPLKGYSQMAVTAEDGPDGSAAPTQQPQLYGPLG